MNPPRLHSETPCDRLETTSLITLSPTPEVFCQQLREISVDNFRLNETNDIPTTATTQTAHTLELRHELMYNFKGRYRREFYIKSVTAMEHFREK